MQHRRGNRYSKNYDLRRVEWERLGASGETSPSDLAGSGLHPQPSKRLQREWAKPVSGKIKQRAV